MCELLLLVTPFMKAQRISGFKGILNGEFDDMPEQAFYMVGSIEEAQEKAANSAWLSRKAVIRAWFSCGSSEQVT